MKLHFRFSLRSCLIAVTLFAVCLSWAAYCSTKWNALETARTALREYGWEVDVRYRVADESSDYEPSRMARLLWFPQLNSVRVYGLPNLPSNLRFHLNALSGAEAVEAFGVSGSELALLVGSRTTRVRLEECNLEPEELVWLFDGHLDLNEFDAYNYRLTRRELQQISRLPGLEQLKCGCSLDDWGAIAQGSFPALRSGVFYCEKAEGSFSRPSVRWLEVHPAIQSIELSGPGASMVMKHLGHTAVVNFAVSGITIASDELVFMQHAARLSHLQLFECDFDGPTFAFILQEGPSRMLFFGCDLPSVGSGVAPSARLSEVVCIKCKGTDWLRAVCDDRSITFREE